MPASDLVSVLASTAESGGEEHHNATPFYVAGGLFAAFAVGVAAIGISRPDFPKGAGSQRGLMLLMVVLALGAIVTAAMA